MAQSVFYLFDKKFSNVFVSDIEHQRDKKIKAGHINKTLNTLSDRRAFDFLCQEEHHSTAIQRGERNDVQDGQINRNHGHKLEEVIKSHSRRLTR